MIDLITLPGADIERSVCPLTHDVEHVSPRRDRLATVRENGEMDYRVNVHHRLNVLANGAEVELAVKHADVLPFSSFGHVTFEIIDDDTLQERSAETYGERLMRALGDAPVRLVRCPASED